jgi:hypothetical protein
MASLTDVQADAEQLAASYGFNAEALRFQYQRRSFGSFTTTIDGSPEQCARYFRAWQIAFARQAAE